MRPATKKERPIPFGDEMVRAIRDGRKTQFRRAGKWQNPEYTGLDISYVGDDPVPVASYRAYPGRGTARGAIEDCPYGAIGGRLWVREAHAINPKLPASMQVAGTALARHVRYRAEGVEPWNIWRPSPHMPRWASRILLEVTDVRVERVQEISRQDAKAEGFHPGLNGLESYGGHLYGNSQLAFRDFWDSTAKPGQKWSDNPWVWAVTFKVLEGGADHA